MRSAAPSSSKTFVAKLHPWAARFNLKPLLSDVTLANILAGDTCSPISLTDFEKHLTFVEYSVENLQFLVWFQDYRSRYLRLHPVAKISGPENEFTFGAPSCARTERLAAESLAKLEGMNQESDQSTSPATASPLVLPSQYTTMTPSTSTSTLNKSADSHETHFCAECQRIIATFLSPGAPKELSLDATVRDTVIRNLGSSCHPDIFLPVYEEIYDLMEKCSIPRFLAGASANINLPKQIYWYSVGILNITFSVILALLLIMMVPTPPAVNRAWRLFSVVLGSLGAAQCYSAWRGYCSQVWLRGNTQLRVWEMHEIDEEAKAFVDRILGPQNANLKYGGSGTPSFDDKLRSPDLPLEELSKTTSKKDLAAIAPFTIAPVTSDECPSQSVDTISSYGFATSQRFRRPPVFGPETVVLDPHIKAVHRQLLFDVCRFGVWFMLSFSAVVFAVPGRLHS
ncbi:hypothetical protein Hypma_012964 [Hypsizygus marmoreus]|uniref:RGS domain-containing protein n=1 Tax=Hypsizygus marmoreus TaxID=39966 RepID=A0A369JH70_HYPMA|nr:hypothetical protein Hypma_012964 [Hypsizygus marmoreus]